MVWAVFLFFDRSRYCGRGRGYEVYDMTAKCALLLSIVLLALAASCSDDLGDTVVEWSGVIQDGKSISFLLTEGTYRLEMTATGDGASVEWLGGNCRGTGQTNASNDICELTQSGRLTVANPSTFGFVSSSSVTVLVTEIE